MHKKILKWAPRVLALLFILFFVLFSLDVFAEGYDFLTLLWALFMHNIPTLILILLLIVAWKYEFEGGIAFIILGIIFTIFFDTYESLISFLIITLPMLLTGALFIWNGHKKKKHKKKK